MMKKHIFNAKPAALAVALGFNSILSGQALAQDSGQINEEDVERIEVKGSLGSLPGQDVESVFGFGKSILETPRSASFISDEQMNRFNVSDIDELVAFAPGVFTQSFFGVAGSLDVRGTPGETYFRGVRRLDNPGNYPTPIAASSSVDIVRGPASPIYGPSKIGGYLNFNPKTAKVGRGKYVEAPTGAISYTTGSWDKSVMTAEVGGPAQVSGKDFGYYVYAELENSDSFYRNSETDQTVLQGAFDMDLSESVTIEFGGMHHRYDGNQNAGWNRVTQELIDNGTYITGDAQPLDTDGDGSISHGEYFDGFNFSFDLFPFVGDPQNADASSFDPQLALVNVGTATLGRDQVLIAADDVLENEVNTLYFDVTYYSENGWELKNQMFYEEYKNLNENAYGFSQFHDSWVFENKLIFATEYETDNMLAQLQVSPSIRYTDYASGDDFINEFFDRRDLTGPSTALDRRLLATRAGTGYSNYNEGDYLNLGFAVLSDITWEFGLNLVLGARFDDVDVDVFSPNDRYLFAPGEDRSASASDDGWSWNASISYKTPLGLIPYVTAATQSTLIAGQGANITVEQVLSGDGGFFGESDLLEFGVKGSFLDDSLYFAFASFEQDRTDFNAQQSVTNNTTETEGLEFEVRWAVTEQLLVSASFTDIEVVNRTALDGGFYFSFFGAEDLPNVTDPSVFYGGTPNGSSGVYNPEAKKAGIPENIYSLTATYDFQNGYAASVSVIDVDEVSSGHAGNVILPDYTIVNTGVSYETDTFSINLTIKNLTDEEYFRSNFPDLFGSQIVLPELPRHYSANFAYKF